MREISPSGFFDFKSKMENENTDNTQTQENMADEPVNNTDVSQPSSGEAGQTAAADVPQAQPTNTEKTFTQKQVDAMFNRRLDAAVQAKLKKMLGEDAEGTLPDVKQLQQQLTEYQTANRNFEAKEQIRDYFADVRNKTQVRPESSRLVENLVLQKLEYDDDGSPANLKEAIEAVKSEASPLFITAATQINGYTGKATPTVVDMNTLIRQTAGRG